MTIRTQGREFEVLHWGYPEQPNAPPRRDDETIIYVQRTVDRVEWWVPFDKKWVDSFRKRDGEMVREKFRQVAVEAVFYAMANEQEWSPAYHADVMKVVL